MKKVIAILIFDGAEEMDFVGPLEVLAAAAETEQDWRVVTVAATLDPIRCEKGMRVIPDCTYADVDRAEVIVIPGGSGARREIDNPLTIQWLRFLAPQCRWVTSVCTGAFLLVGSGVAQDRQVTTHHRFIGKLRDLGAINVVEARVSCTTAT
jgi:putative intracellular protease/amidase